MNKNKTLKDEIVIAVRGELGLFRDEIGQDVRSQIELLRNGIDERFDGVDQRFGEVDQQFGGINQRFDEIDRRFDLVDKRFDAVDDDLGCLEIMIGDVDDKFSLVTEGQDLIREVLETRVVNIEEILGLQNRV